MTASSDSCLEEDDLMLDTDEEGRRASMLSPGGRTDQDSCQMQIGLYRGNLVTIKKVSKKAVDLNRAILKELNTVRQQTLKVFPGYFCTNLRT